MWPGFSVTEVFGLTRKCRLALLLERFWQSVNLFCMLSLVKQLSGLTVKWFTDNQNVPRIISSGSSKEHLQSEALSIFNICCSHGISIEMEWIPRSQNDQADFLSRSFDSDDCGLSPLSFHHIDVVWGPHSVAGSFRKLCECQTPSFQFKILESRF